MRLAGFTALFLVLVSLQAQENLTPWYIYSGDDCSCDIGDPRIEEI